MPEHTTITAGIDVGKANLDGDARRWRFANDVAGRKALLACLADQSVLRVGLEASGGYERDIVDALRGAGLEVVLLQPRQVRAYATFRLLRAKTDAIDAGLIAACAKAHGAAREAPDPRLADLAEPLRFVEQLDDDVARLKTRAEAYRCERLRGAIAAQIKALKAERAAEIARILRALEAEPDLARRLELIVSIPGLGQRTALTLAIRMPELGRLTREQAASLAGLAPFDHASGRHQGQARIAGGRAVVRTALYAAALPAAFRWNTALADLYKRLKAKGKNHKQALIACARKLITYANAVIAKNQKWQAI